MRSLTITGLSAATLPEAKPEGWYIMTCSKVESRPPRDDGALKFWYHFKGVEDPTLNVIHFVTLTEKSLPFFKVFLGKMGVVVGEDDTIDFDEHEGKELNVQVGIMTDKTSEEKRNTFESCKPV